MLVYVAGCYTGKTEEETDENIHKARVVAIDLWKAGYTAICPHLNTYHFEREVVLELNPSDYVNRDLEIISKCDAVILVDNWQKSEGAKREANYALSLGIPIVYSLEELKRIDRMSPEQEAHLQSIKNRFCRLVDKKYRKGQKEHGGNLWLKDPLPLAIEECLDLPVYLFTLEQQVAKGDYPLKQALDEKDETCERCGGIHPFLQECRGSED